LNALGVEFLDAGGNRLKAIPEELSRMANVDASKLDKRISNCDVVILCDVNNKLLGTEGAAAVFGPQKGASGQDVQQLEACLANFAKVSLGQAGVDMASLKHGGAAGGATAGLHTWLGAKLVNGIGYFLQLTGFDEALKRADLVITGEGSLDSQTLQGKGPYGVAAEARKTGIKVIGLAGKVGDSAELRQYFDELISINPESFDIAEAMKNTRKSLINTAKLLGDRLT